MNRNYKVIWNASLNCFMAVSEYAKARGKSSKSSVSSNATINTTSNLSSTSAFKLTAMGLGLIAAGLMSPQVFATGSFNTDAGLAISNSACTTSADANGKSSVAIGCNSVAGDDFDLVDRMNPNYSFGPPNTVKPNTSSVAIGSGAVAKDVATAIGSQARAEGRSSVALGVAAYSTGNTSLAIGRQSAATEDFAQAIGNVSSATGKGSLAIGHSALASGKRGIAIGSTKVNKKEYAGQAGVGYETDGQTEANGTDSIAFGSGAKATVDKSIALGEGASASYIASVALGAGSTTLNDATEEKNLIIGNKIYNYAGATQNKGAQVSIGSEGLERQVKHVAAGKVNPTSTDAVNGSQLNATNESLKDLSNTVITNKTKYYSVASTAAGAGSNANNDGATKPNAMAMGGNASATGEQAIAIGSGDSGQHTTASGEQSIALGANVESSGHSSIAIGGDDLDDASKVDGVNDTFKYYTGNDLIENSATPYTGHTKSDGAASIAIGVKAQSEGYLSTAVGVRSSSSGDASSAFGMGSSASQKGSVALGAGSIASEEDSVALGSFSKTDTVVGTTGITLNGSTYVFSGTTPTSTVSIGGGLKDGVVVTRTITNVAAGRINGASTDAINGSQLHATNESVKDLSTTVVANKTHYYSVEDGGTPKANYNNDGAIGSNAMAAGIGSEAKGDQATAVGYKAKAVASESTAIGREALAEGHRSVALGYAAKAKGPQSVAIGDNAETQARSAIAISLGAKAFNGSSTAIGKDADTNTATDAIAFGTGANVKNRHGIAMGVGATSVGDSALALDSGSQANGLYTVAIGKGAIAKDGKAVSIGSENTASGDGAVAIGDPNVATGAGAVAIGKDNTATGIGAIALGNGSIATKDSNIALGNKAQATGNQSIAQGSHAMAMGSQSIAQGTYAKATGNFSSAQGYFAEATKSNSIAYGRDAKALGENSIAIGKGNTVSGTNSIAVGTGHTIGGDNSGAFGDPNVVNGNNSYAVGNNNTIDADNSFVLGNNITINAINKNSIALGESAIINGEDSIAIGRNASAAAGTRNGIAVGVRSKSGNHAVSLGDDSASGNYAVAIGSKAKTQIGGIAIGQASSAVSDATALGRGAIAGQSGNVALGNSSVTAAQHTGSFSINNLPVAGLTSGARTVSVGTVGAERQIQNVAPGVVSTTSTDVINGSQLHATNSAVGDLGSTVSDGLNFVGDRGAVINRQLGDTLNIKGGVASTATLTNNNIGIRNDDSNGLIVELAEKVNLGTNGSVNVGNTQVRNTGITIAGSTLSNTVVLNNSGLNNGGFKVINVDKGDVNTTSTDAINGSQLFGTAQSIANNFGGGSVVNTNGTVSTPVYQINGNNQTGVAGAIAELDKGFNLDTNGAAISTVKAGDTIDIGTAAGETNIEVAKTGNIIDFKLADNIKLTSVTTGGSVLNNNGLTIAGGPSFTSTGINAGNQQITGVLSGGVLTDVNNQLNAANISDVKNAVGDVTILGFGLKAADGNTVMKPLGEQVEVIGSNSNITTTAASGKVEVALNNNLDLGTTGSVKMGSSNSLPFGSGPVTTVNSLGLSTGSPYLNTNVNALGVFVNGPAGIPLTTLTANGLDIIGGPSVTRSGIDAGNKRIIRVSNGIAPTDAVNVSQLTGSAAASKTEVEAGTNVAVTNNPRTNGQNVYTIDADGTTASAGSPAVTVTPVLKIPTT